MEKAKFAMWYVSFKLLHCFMKITRWVKTCAECMVKKEKKKSPLWQCSLNSIEAWIVLSFHYVMLFPVLATNKGMLNYIFQGWRWFGGGGTQKTICVMFCKTFIVKWTQNFWDTVNFIKWSPYHVSQTFKMNILQNKLLVVTGWYSLIL